MLQRSIKQLMKYDFFQKLCYCTHCLKDMPVINKDLSLEEAATRTTTKLTSISLSEVLEGASTDRKYLLCILLHAKKCVKAVSYFKMSQGQKQRHETSFNRFLLLGVLGTDKVIAIFTYNQQESVELLRFCDHLTPGKTCALIRGKFDHKFMGTVSTTPIVSTVEPLVPLNMKSFPIVSCPRNVSSPDFVQFNIMTKNLTLTNVDAVSPVCNGVFCDGQPKGECPCLEVDNRNTSWVLSADVACSEIYHSAKIRSKNLISLFAPECKKADPSKRLFDVLDLSDCVDACVAKINAASGWKLFGWLKPTETALETTNYDCDIHIVHICPCVPAEITAG